MKASLWSFRAMSIGVLCTLLPFLTISFLALHSSSTAPPSVSHLSRVNDVITAMIVFLFSAVVEGTFLIAPFVVAHHAVRAHTRISSADTTYIAETSQQGERSSYPSMPQRIELFDSAPVTIFSSLGFRTFSPYWLLLLIPLLLLVLGIDAGYTLLVQYLHIQVQTNDQALMQQASSAPLTTYATLLIAVLIAPFCEEVFFRSFLLPGLQHLHLLFFSILFSSLLFAVAHVDVGSLVPLFCIGVLLGVVRVYSNSIWPSILLHTANNLVASLAVIFSMSLVPVLHFR